jgi:dethiobiotin synthetase
MIQQGYFITGTDTNAGKTWATLALMQAFQRQGKTVAGMKPIASGCRFRDGKLENEDALLLQAHASVFLDYGLINPYAYELPISPHLAGRDNPADFFMVMSRLEELQQRADLVLVEGAGGWYAPVNPQQDISDLALALGLPVILAVGIKLGCINHARLTAEAIALKGARFAGWIAVCNDPGMRFTEANIATLRESLRAPLLGTIPYLPDADLNDLGRFLKLDRL